MKNLLAGVCIFCSMVSLAQLRNINRFTLESTYSNSRIHQSIRELVDAVPKEKYFDDAFFNEMLVKITQDKQFAEHEKANIFYLMLKKIGYAFTGIDYLPPKQSYFSSHQGKVYILTNTQKMLGGLKYNGASLLNVADTSRNSDPVLSGSALLLATLLDPVSAARFLSDHDIPQKLSSNAQASILIHYYCLSSSLFNDSLISKNLVGILKANTHCESKEDALCGIYSGKYPVSLIKEYITAENDARNGLAVQTALCALADKVPPASFKQSVKSLMTGSKEKWKSDLLKKIFENKLPFNYSISSADQLVVKPWTGVTFSPYVEGYLISSGSLMEFDPN